MPMGRNKALPMETREFPDYVYYEFPKVIGRLDGPGEGEKTVVVANDAAHEVELRVLYPDFLPFVPPPSSMKMDDFKASMLELDLLRKENARLRLKAGEVVIADDNTKVQPKPAAPREVDREPPGTSSDALAAGEDKHGDPWANQPENQTPSGSPPSIKPPSVKTGNKLK